MKRVWLLYAFIVCHCLLMQAGDPMPLASSDLEVSDVKWVYLKFSSDVKYADMGSDDILLEKTQVPSILRVKSEVPSFDKTSVTVISLDGIVHTYNLRYQQNPLVIAYEIRREGKEEIPARAIELSHRQTSHIVFSERVVDVQAGSDSIIVDWADGIDNIIKCRSVSPGFDYFDETSLTLITESHEVYPFVVRYKEYPEVVNLNFSNMEGKTGGKAEAIFSSLSVNEPAMQEYGRKALARGYDVRNLGVIKDKMSFSLFGIYVYEDVMMFYLSVENLAKIDYEIDFIKSYIVNKKTTKNQASQADEKVPLFTYKESSSEVIPAAGKYGVVFFYKRFTIPDKHSLYFEVFEKNGGRHLKFTVPHKSILKAKHL